MLHGSRSPSPDEDVERPLTHVEEQEKLRKETIAAFHNAVPEGDEDDFLIPREKTKDELEREEEKYRAFLEREVGDLRDLVSIDGVSDEEHLEVMDHVANEAVSEEDGSSRKKKKKKKKVKDGVDESGSKQNKTKAEADQEFLMKCVCFTATGSLG